MASMKNIVGKYTVTLECKIKHPIKNAVKMYIAQLILKPILFICRNCLKFELEMHIIEKQA